MNCTTSRFAALCGVAFLLATPTVTADPTGIEYGVILDALVVPPIGGPAAFESHEGLVTFDGAPDPVPGAVLSADPSFLPANELIVTEHLVFNPDGSETIAIWLEGQDPVAPFPTPGAPLFANPLDLSPGLVFSGTFDLVWGEGPLAGEIDDIEVAVSFPGDIELGVSPVFVGVLGEGTPESPLELAIELDPFDLYLPVPLGDGTVELGGFVPDGPGIPATDLHISFTVRHVPEPSSVGLAAIGLLAVAGVARWRCA